MKKITNRVLSLVFCVCFFIETSLVCFASAPFLSVFDVFSYSVTSEGITITNIDSNAEGVIDIPDEINGKPVISVNLFPALRDCVKVSSVNIPKSVISINGLKNEDRNCNLLSEITVDVDNTVYESNNGVLYTKGLNKLLVYPQGKTDIEFTLPNSVKCFDINAFINANNLKVINLSKSMEDPTALLPKSLSRLNVDEENIYFASVDGVLYSKNLKSLIYMPRNSTIKNFIFLNETEEIYPEAFMDCNIETVSLNDKIETIEMDSFKNCSFLKEIDLKNVKIIKENAFNGCSLLEKVYLCKDVQLIDNNAFDFDLTALCFYMDGEPTAKGTYYSVENGKLVKNGLHDHMLTFVVDGKTYYKTTMTEGEKIIFPSNPGKPGYAFNGWLPEMLEYMPDYDLTFYAMFEKNESQGDETSVEIRNYINSQTIDYGTTITFVAIVENMPLGASVVWYKNGQKAGSGESFTVEKSTEPFMVQATVVSESKEMIAGSSTELVIVKTDFLSKLIGFLKWLFNALPIIEQ